MYEGKSHTLFAKYAVPQMIGLLFNSVYMIVDGAFIGNWCGIKKVDSLFSRIS